MERLLTRKEAAQLLGISPATLDLARKKGRISFIQYIPNGSVFFTTENLQEYLAKNTRRAIPSEKQRQTYRTVRKSC